jgi:ATP-dependent Lon protease
MNALDQKLNEVFPGKVVRKDLVNQIKKAANVPSFVLEFLLSKYCASNDPDEIEMGKKAVLEVIETNYVRPDESNKAQSMVQQHGRFKFIDKVHVRYVEGERRHWAEMENFNSRRIAIPEKFYKENERLLESGMWAEVIIAHNDIEEDSYAFYVEDLKPIQLSKFKIESYFEGRKSFSTQEWIDVILRSVGLKPETIDNPPEELKKNFPSASRLKMHFITRLIPLVQNNYNYIELGPRSTGKSHFYSEFSPYCTLLSGGQASTATLLYNNARKKVGAVGFWDNIAFDEVGKVKIKDADTLQIMKDYMAKGRFSRGQEVIANASFSFVGNIDYSIPQLVNSYKHDLFITLPKEMDLAIQDRLFYFLPGWEMPKMDEKFYTTNFGLITDYMAEAFHFLSKNSSHYVDIVNRRLKLGPNIEGRDQLAINRTMQGFLKILYPGIEPTDEEFDQLTEFAVEGRRRVKEQMNKRKPDDEYAKIDLSYINKEKKNIIVFCPESKESEATRNPRNESAKTNIILENQSKTEPKIAKEIISKAHDEFQIELKEKRITVHYGDIGYGYESLFTDYLIGAETIVLEDSYIRKKHQIVNFVRFCELIVKVGDCKRLELVTCSDNDQQKEENSVTFDQIRNSLLSSGVEFVYRFDPNIHKRIIRLSNGWNIILDRGLDYFQSLEGNFFQLGANDLDLRPCAETYFDFFKDK